MVDIIICKSACHGFCEFCIWQLLSTFRYLQPLCPWKYLASENLWTLPNISDRKLIQNMTDTKFVNEFNTVDDPEWHMPVWRNKLFLNKRLCDWGHIGAGTLAAQTATSCTHVTHITPILHSCPALCLVFLFFCPEILPMNFNLCAIVADAWFVMY